MFVDPLTARRTEDAHVKLSTSRPAGADIVIGLVNIMPPAAMRSIETLFRLLLGACASPGKIHLRLFAPRIGAAEAAVPQHYESLDDLWDSPDSDYPLDALIVTGTESRAPSMQDEACWPDLQKICDWAGENTVSTIWSCFSAHAAVLHLDNIHRQAFAEKLSGIFECEKASSHSIFKNLPAQWPAPHSRYNNLNEAELVASGYEILSRAPGFGADSFTKQYRSSRFLFLQGHLEYGPEMLFSEYCRDLKRHALGQSAICPKPPQNYFDQAALAAFAKAAPEALSSADFVNEVTAGLRNDWQTSARLLYTAWLDFIAEQKTGALLASAAALAGGFTMHASETPAHIAPP